MNGRRKVNMGFETGLGQNISLTLSFVPGIFVNGNLMFVLLLKYCLVTDNRFCIIGLASHVQALVTPKKLVSTT